MKRMDELRESLRFLFHANSDRDGNTEEYLDAVAAVTTGVFHNFDGSTTTVEGDDWERSLQYIILLKANLDDREREYKKQKRRTT